MLFMLDIYLTLGVELVKNTYKILSIFCVLLLCATPVLATDKEHNSELLFQGSKSLSKTRGSIGKHSLGSVKRDKGLTASGNGGGVIIFPDKARFQPTKFCLAGFCISP